MEYCLLRLLSRAETIKALQKQGVVAFITATGAQLLPQLPGPPPACLQGAAVCCFLKITQKRRKGDML